MLGIYGQTCQAQVMRNNSGQIRHEYFGKASGFAATNTGIKLSANALLAADKPNQRNSRFLSILRIGSTLVCTWEIFLASAHSNRHVQRAQLMKSVETSYSSAPMATVVFLGMGST